MARKTTGLAAVFIAGFLITPDALRAFGPGACPRDSKLLNDGPTSVFGDGPGMWWGAFGISDDQVRKNAR